MSIHIQRFVDRVRGQEARGARDFTMSMADAKDLHTDITRLLITLQTLQENIANNSPNDPVVSVQMDGGRFR
jgi:hypothetical protein